MLLGHSLFQSFSLSASTMPIKPQFPVIDPSLCLVDFCEYKKRLKITEEAFKDTLSDYPHNVNELDIEKLYNKKPWR